MNVAARASSWVFPLILAVLLGGVTFWLNRATDLDVKTTTLNPNEPQYQMQGISAVKFDSEGKQQQTLVAKSAHMFPENTDLMLVKPDGYMYQNEAPLYHVQAEQARYSDLKDQLFFDKNVVFSKSSSDGKPEAVVKTSQVHIDIPTQVASSDQLVEYEYGQSNGTAVGFNYDKKNDVLHLQSRVKAIIYEQP